MIKASEQLPILKPAQSHVQGCVSTHLWAQPAGAEVELEGGQKLSAKLVVLGDGVHSKTANKYHKMALKTVDIAAWRFTILSCHTCPLCMETCIIQIHRIRVMHCCNSTL